MSVDRFFEFTASDDGQWRIDRILPVIGCTLSPAPRLSVRVIGLDAPRNQGSFTLRGVRSNERYIGASERSGLVAIQADLGRPQARSAALIPISKSATWWALAQDQRRAILQERSRHITIGSEYLPAVARRLYHCRDIGEPFDFLTWFEYAPEDEPAFEDLLARLRATPEWQYVEHEVDVRLTLAT